MSAAFVPTIPRGTSPSGGNVRAHIISCDDLDSPSPVGSPSASHLSLSTLDTHQNSPTSQELRAAVERAAGTMGGVEVEARYMTSAESFGNLSLDDTLVPHKSAMERARDEALQAKEPRRTPRRAVDSATPLDQLLKPRKSAMERAKEEALAANAPRRSPVKALHTADVPLDAVLRKSYSLVERQQRAAAAAAAAGEPTGEENLSPGRVSRLHMEREAGSRLAAQRQAAEAQAQAAAEAAQAEAARAEADAKAEAEESFVDVADELPTSSADSEYASATLVSYSAGESSEVGFAATAGESSLALRSEDSLGSVASEFRGVPLEEGAGAGEQEAPAELA